MEKWGHECGTAMCIAGWTLKLSEESPRVHRSGSLVADRARQLLDLTHAQGSRLFYKNNWPYEFHLKSVLSHTDEERAMVAAERIEHLINTGI